MSLSNLASALWTQFKHSGKKNDLDESISLNRQALELRLPPHPDRSTSLNNLANALWTHFIQEGHQNDLDESISLNRQALELRPLFHPDRSMSLSNLANALWTQFKTSGQKNNLDESISLYRQALELCPPPHPDRSTSLNNLANALQAKFMQEGQQNDVDESISLNRQALELRPLPHSDHSTSLNSLASALWIRFKKGDQKKDLDECIFLNRQALELCPPSHPGRSASLNNLAHALWTHFKQGGQKSDLYESISLNRQALELRPPPHPDQSTSLNNLAIALETQFKEEGQQNHLEESISLNRQALELRPPPHPDRSTSLNNLATALKVQYVHGSQQNDLDESISLYKQALELRPSPHPDQSASLYAIGQVLILAHLAKNNNSEYLDQAMSSFFAATQCLSQSASYRLQIAKTWIHYANDIYQHSSAIDAYIAALQALPQLAALSLDIQSRHRALTDGSDGLARDASRCAIQARKLDKAIEFLEAGRTIFWSQLLSLRSPLDKLHNIAPDLADQLQQIATALELGSYSNMSIEHLNNQMKLVQDLETFQLNHLHEKWTKTITSVRCLKGFEDFLQPHQLSSLQATASEFPVVTLVANKSDSNILIMTSTDIHHILISKLPAHELHRLVQLIQATTSYSKMQRSSVDIFPTNTSALSPAISENFQNWLNMEAERGGRKFKHKINSDDIFKSVLKTLWIDVVKPVITFLGLEVGLQFKVNYSIHLWHVLEIRETICIAMVSYWPIFLSSYPCSWLL